MQPFAYRRFPGDVALPAEGKRGTGGCILGRAGAATARGEQRRTQPTEGCRTSMTTVMLVDDSATMLMSLKSILTKAGFSVETAGHGKEALDKLGKGVKPNLIISDVNMPQMDGITFVREARKAPGMRFTPMLMLTT